MAVITVDDTTVNVEINNKVTDPDLISFTASADSGVSSSNLGDAVNEIAEMQKVGTAIPASGEEGSFFYDTDDDILYVRKDSAWAEVSFAGGSIDGGTY